MMSEPLAKGCSTLATGPANVPGNLKLRGAFAIVGSDCVKSCPRCHVNVRHLLFEEGACDGAAVAVMKDTVCSSDQESMLQKALPLPGMGCCRSWRGYCSSCHLTSLCSFALPQLRFSLAPAIVSTVFVSHTGQPVKDRLLLSSLRLANYRQRPGVPEFTIYQPSFARIQAQGGTHPNAARIRYLFARGIGIWQRKLTCHMAITGTLQGVSWSQNPSKISGA